MIFPQTYENQGVEGCGVNENWPHKKICLNFGLQVVELLEKD